MRTNPTRLLVSVRSDEEAIAALAGGAAVIDIKEPDRGALGAADPRVWRSVLDVVDGRAPVSAALGELYGDAQAKREVERLAAQTAGLAFAKIGLAGAAKDADWPAAWAQSLSALPPTVDSVAVVYADWPSAAAPAPEEIIDRGASLGCRLVLLDTFAKWRGSLLDHLPPPTLQRLTHRATQLGMRVVLAGSLTQALVPRLLPLRPALIAVRGAVCRGSRGGAIDAAKVRALAGALESDVSISVDASQAAAADA